MTSRHKNPQYNLRMPEALKDKLKDSADARGVSLNAEIIYRLEQSFAGVESEGTGEERLQKVERTLELMWDVLQEGKILPSIVPYSEPLKRRVRVDRKSKHADKKADNDTDPHKDTQYGA